MLAAIDDLEPTGKPPISQLNVVFRINGKVSELKCRVGVPLLSENPTPWPILSGNEICHWILRNRRLFANLTETAFQQ